MNLIKHWLNNAWPKHRHTPDADSVRELQKLHQGVFGTPAGREWIEAQFELLLNERPDIGNANACIAYAQRWAVIADIALALDRADHPAKYKEFDKAKATSRFDPRMLKMNESI